MKVYFATLRCGPSDVAFLKKKNRVESVRCCPFTLTHGERMNKSPILIFPYNFGFLDALKKERTLCFPLLDFSLSLPLSFEKRVKFKAKKKKLRGGIWKLWNEGEREKKKSERERMKTLRSRTSRSVAGRERPGVGPSLILNLTLVYTHTDIQQIGGSSSSSWKSHFHRRSPASQKGCRLLFIFEKKGQRRKKSTIK